ncbi:MAG: KpsF/GutQ family sugar-phosphate isomerase [Planctomycetes bacterium]|nr:KpsF/GutQ family sugar-phosphate isomerase [Planctomycetota bacterium]
MKKRSGTDLPSAETVLEIGREVLARESAAIDAAQQGLGEGFVAAVRIVLDCPQRVALTGMGKAGQIGFKIQSTLSSTGTPAYFLHPVEALHGDLGMVHRQDVLMALSNSGFTQEMVELLPVVKRIGCPIVLITGRPDSRCGELADVVLDVGDTPEACPLGLAPSSSTTAMLAMGDALALTVMKLKDVRPEQYAAVHPGGALGRSLMKVGEVMRTGPDCPTMSVEGSAEDYFEAIAGAPSRAGAAAVIDKADKLVGIFTHGDLFRLNRRGELLRGRRVAEIMTAHPKRVREDDLVAAAIRLIQAHGLDELPVVDDQECLVGMVDVQDLIRRGFSVFDDN